MTPTTAPRHVLFQAEAIYHAMGGTSAWRDLPNVEKQVWIDRALVMREKYNDLLLAGRRYTT